MMTSHKQIKANRKNALKGGVKTDRGKKASSRNASKHDVLSLRVKADEQPRYNELVEHLYSDYQPNSVVQKVLTERIALHVIQLERLNQASNQMWQACIDPEIRVSQFDVTFDEVVNVGYQPTIDLNKIKTLMPVFHRYQTRLENQLMKIDRAIRT